MIVFALTYLIGVSDTVTFYIKHLRNKSKLINKFFSSIEGHTKEKTRKTLSATHPETIRKGESCSQFVARMEKERAT